jgi:hypothetical protein
MPTKNQMIFDVMNLAYGGEQSDDVKVSEVQVSLWIDQYRATFIKNKMKAGGSLPDVFIQNLECVNMELYEEIDGCNILRSTSKIPETITGNDTNLITSVYAGEGSNSVFFSETSYFRRRTNKFNKYTAKARRWFLNKGYLNITNDMLTEVISVAGVFENPEAAANFCSVDGAACYSLDDPYPISEDMAKDITSLLLKERFGIVVTTESDEQNNSQQNPRNDNN